ncbi:MAG: response regulator [Cyanobacteria bacterium P01_F01_bin.33]
MRFNSPPTLVSLMSLNISNRTTDYPAERLKSLLEGLNRLKFTGVARVTVRLDPPNPLTPTRVLVFRDGTLTYGGAELPTNIELSQQLANLLNRNMVATAATFALNKMENKSSERELAEMLVRLRVVKWDEIVSTLQTQTILALEQVLPHAGRIELDETAQFDLVYGDEADGLEWDAIFAQVSDRLQIWQTLAPGIPSMWAVPEVPNGDMRKVTDPKARQHIVTWVDGKRSLIDIARETHSDPIDVARSYLSWAETGWIEFAGGAAVKPDAKLQNLPAILSVDDSPIVQTLIKRSLTAHYQVLLASNAMEALNILNREQVTLLLLDVTMPVIDGLEFCKTLRKIPKFKTLPIVMLTARDGNINKMKGQIAGTNRYLTKPVQPEELLEVVREYVK